MKKVTVTLQEDGQIAIEAEGFTGGACATLTGPIEEALGMDASQRDLKPEFFETARELELNP